MHKAKCLFVFSIFALGLNGCVTHPNAVLHSQQELRPMQPIYLPLNEPSKVDNAQEQAKKAPFVARWLEGIPGQFQKFQGFELFADGRAKSINMATLVYESWKLDGNKLILWGKSIGNHITTSFTEEWEVVLVSDKKLVLKRENLYKTYLRG